LPQNYREAVILCELEEMSYEEAAAALDCPVGTVRSRLHRARALLVEKLHDSQPISAGIGGGRMKDEARVMGLRAIQGDLSRSRPAGNFGIQVSRTGSGARGNLCRLRRAADRWGKRWISLFAI
jgi:hypothetical protein